MHYLKTILTNCYGSPNRDNRVEQYRRSVDQIGIPLVNDCEELLAKIQKNLEDNDY
jgi:hypothetical protein